MKYEAKCEPEDHFWKRHAKNNQDFARLERFLEDQAGEECHCTWCDEVLTECDKCEVCGGAGYVNSGTDDDVRIEKCICKIEMEQEDRLDDLIQSRV